MEDSYPSQAETSLGESFEVEASTGCYFPDMMAGADGVVVGEPYEQIASSVAIGSYGVESVTAEVWKVEIEDLTLNSRVGENLRAETDTYTRILTSEHPDGNVIYSDSVADVSLVANRRSILIFEVVEIGLRPRNIVRAVLTFDNGEATFVGACQEEYNGSAQALSDHLDLSVLDVIQEWATAKVDSATGETKFVSLLRELEYDTQQKEAASAWLSAPPELRSLRPADVPVAVQKTLDVRALQIALTDVPSTDFVVVRTASGVSGAIRGSVLPSTEAVYFAQDDEIVEVLLAASIDDFDGRVIASIAVDELRRSNGWKMVGSVSDVSLEPLDDEELARMIGLSSIDDLEDFRQSLLGRG